MVVDETTTATTADKIKKLIRDVPDFPQPGVIFRDITPLLADAAAFSDTIASLAERIASYRPDGIVAIESRGFVLGAALALQMGIPLQLIRKQGKLPGECVGISYALEYGQARVEMHADAIMPGGAYVLIDDLIATGGTAAAAVDLIERQKGSVACCAFVIELDFLHGRDRLGGRPIESLVHY